MSERRCQAAYSSVCLSTCHSLIGKPTNGGYQVFSLAALRELDEEGVAFRSHLDGTAYLLTPERSIQVQMNLGADLVMAFDECPPWPAPREAVVEATDRTTRWAERSRRAHTRSDQWLFGIVQGGVHSDLREKSARELRGAARSGSEP